MSKANGFSRPDTLNSDHSTANWFSREYEYTREQSVKHEGGSTPPSTVTVSEVVNFTSRWRVVEMNDSVKAYLCVQYRSTVTSVPQWVSVFTFNSPL